MNGGHASSPSRAWVVGQSIQLDQTSALPSFGNTRTILTGAPILALVLWLCGLGETFGQTLDDVRDQLRQSLGDVQFAASFAGLIAFSDELELSGARYELDDGDGNLSDTKLSTLALPFRKRFHPWGDAVTSIYAEGVVGYASTDRQANDLYSGAIPAAQTSVDSDSKTYGGLLGVGPEFRVIKGVRVASILNVGVAYIENDADYGGPGAQLSSQLLDGLAFNWDAWTVSGGGALRADWLQALGRGCELEVVCRYDLRWTQTFATDDEAQEFSSRLQLITLRADVVGPTGLTPFERMLYWRVLSGYRHFFEGGLSNVHDMVLLGGGIEYDIAGILPLGSRVSVRGGVIVGDKISGYTVGAGLSF